MKFSNNERQVNTHNLLFRKLAVLAMAFSMLVTSPGTAFLSYATEPAADKQATAEQSDAPKSEITDETQKSNAAATDADDKEQQKEDKEAAAASDKEAAAATSKDSSDKSSKNDADSDKVATDTGESENGVMEVSSETGSYTVDFYYTPENGKATEYHLKGGSEIMLSELFAKLGIDRDTADIKEAVFTDNELVRFVKEGDDYRVISLKPFNTTESLTITFEDDEVVVLSVKDAVGPRDLGNSTGVKWMITDAGVLTIYPTNGDYGRIGGVGTYADNNSWPWKSYANQITSIKVEGVVGTMPNTRLTYMFRGMKKVTTADVSGFDFTINADGEHVDGRGTVDSLAYMFYECSALTSVKGAEKLSSVNNKRVDYMFYNCEKLTTIEGIGQLETKSVEQMQRMFSGCKSLTQLDLSGWKNPGKVHNMNNMFRESGLTTITMPGSEFKTRNDSLMESMFQDCKSLTSVNFGTADNHMDVSMAKTMTNMFKNCSALTSLDVSSFGNLTHIINMDGFVEGCSSLETLNIDNLDNSVIGPTNNRHSISDGLDPSVGAREYGRALFGLDGNNKGKSIDSELPKLKTISAKNSKVWMVHNNRGTPGNEYYNAAEESAIYYFTKKEINFDSDKGTSVVIDSDRDYIDIITDRDGTNVYKTDPLQNPLPDATKNINIANNDLNTNGAGMLAPGVYTIKSTDRIEPAGAPMCDTFYRIAYIGEVPYEVECDHPDLIQHDGQDNTYITTKAMEWPETGDKTIDCSIKITYKDAAIDVNGKKHDVLIEVTKITFKDIKNIPTNPGADRVHHDNNKYVPDNREYYRPILQANKSDGVQFMNYVRDAAGIDEPWSKEYDCLSKGSGTDIEFRVSIAGAPEDTSFVFKGEDMDVAYSQEWINSTTDACEDELPIKNNTYGQGGEGFVLGDGNDLGTVKFAEHTGLVLVDNTVMTTGSDPHTPWSEFTVKANAYSGAKYKWTSGISCTSYALRNTKAQDVGATSLQPQVLKELINGTLEDDQFEFVLEKVSTDPEGAPEPDVPQTKKNTADGKVTFDKLEYKTEGANDLIDGSDKTPYYPGTSPDGNEHGGGQHNTFTYTYKVYEKIPEDVKTIDGHKVKDNIIYDTTEHTVTIVITTPENDTEMLQGIKAEIYVDKTPGAGVSPDKTYWHHEKACVDCSNGTPTAIPADKWYDENGDEIQDPNPFRLEDLEFKNKKIDPVKLNIPVEKILQGRSWKDTDEFAAGLVLVTNNAPMPGNSQTIGDGHKVSEVLINNEDTPVKNDDDKVIGYKDTFAPITYTIDDLGKTYEYDVRELMPSESSAAPIPGVTYDTEEYDVKVKVTLDETDPDDPKLVATAEYKGKDGEVTISSFTNIYDAEETDYKMEAVKDFWDVSKEEEIQLEAGEFTFAVKPIGENAAIAPMPAGYEGSGADRRYYKTNERDGDIEFEGDPSQIKDGMVFNYKDLLAAGIDDADLHSDKGVDFEYVIYEIIPGTPEGIAKGKTLTSKETLVNNEDGTYSVIGDDYEIVYDGVHHTRKITVKVIQGDKMETGDTVTIDDQTYDVYKDFKEVEYYEKDGKAYKKSDNTPYTPDLETLDVEGHPDDHKACYYISEKDGETKEIPMSEVEGYDPKRHHFKVNEEGEEVQGAPIFINYRFEQKYVDFKVKKVWDDGNDSDKMRPKSITMTITSDEGNYKPKDLVVKGNSWTASEKLPVWEFDIKTEKLKKITYSVEESNVPTGYEVSYSPDPSAITLDPNKSEFAMTVTNKHVPDEIPADDNDDESDESGARGAKTGDSNNVAIWIALMAAAVAAVVAVIIRRRRRS